MTVRSSIFLGLVSVGRLRCEPCAYCPVVHPLLVHTDAVLLGRSAYDGRRTCRHEAFPPLVCEVPGIYLTKACTPWLLDARHVSHRPSRGLWPRFKVPSRRSLLVLWNVEKFGLSRQALCMARYMLVQIGIFSASTGLMYIDMSIRRGTVPRMVSFS